MRELLVDTCETEISAGQVGQYCYYILVDEMEVAEGFSCESYGVKVADLARGEAESVPNITVSVSRIDELIDLLIRNLVTPVTLRDVVEDWL